MKTYKIAAMLEGTGEFEIIEEFDATNDEAANRYAEKHHADIDWYVLDADGDNING